MPSAADGDEALLQQAAERARALIAALSGDAASLRRHQQKDASLAEGVDLCERASHDAAELLRLLEAALHRRGVTAAASSSSPSSPTPDSEQEPS
jgi:hypothetical protein